MSQTKRQWKEVTLDENNVWDKENPLEGTFVKTEQGVGANNSTMYTIKTENGEEVKVWGSVVLDDKLLGVPSGAYVRLEYEGKLTSKKGSQYHGYKVFVDTASLPDQQLTEDDIPADFR